MEMWVIGFFVHITYYYYGHRLPVTPDEAWLALATSSGQMVSISALGHQCIVRMGCIGSCAIETVHEQLLHIIHPQPANSRDGKWRRPSNKAEPQWP